MKSTCECCKALWVKFELTAPLTKQTSKAAAKVYVDDDGHRCYWQGDDPDPNYADPEDSGFDVYNLETGQALGGNPPYQFFGVAGDVGLACLDDSDPEQSRYRVVHLSPPRTALILQPISTIPPAHVDFLTQHLVMGSGLCWVMRRKAGNSHLQYEMVNGERVQALAWNAGPDPIIADDDIPYSGGSGSGCGGTYVYAVQDAFGDLIIAETFEVPCESSSSESFSSSQSESESQSESGSFSESESLSESQSQSESQSLSESGSESLSDESQPESPPSSSESDKSTAIVPASWSPTGFTALFVLEMPEVRFEDVATVKIPQRDGEIRIDPKFIAVCEPNTMKPCGFACEAPVNVGLKVAHGLIQIRFSEQADEVVELTIRLSAIRNGFLGKRFPDRTREQFEANERFIRSAYPGV